MARSPQVPESYVQVALPAFASLPSTCTIRCWKLLLVILLKKFLLCIDAKYRYDCIIAPFEVAFKD